MDTNMIRIPIWIPAKLKREIEGLAKGKNKKRYSTSAFFRRAGEHELERIKSGGK